MKKKQLPNKVLGVADSDLIRLMREFEDLKSQLEQNNKTVADSDDSIRAANIEFNMIRARHEKICANAHRARRLIEVQLKNVRELLNQQLGHSFDDGADVSLTGCTFTGNKVR